MALAPLSLNQPRADSFGIRFARLHVARLKNKEKENVQASLPTYKVILSPVDWSKAVAQSKYYLNDNSIDAHDQDLRYFSFTDIPMLSTRIEIVNGAT